MALGILNTMVPLLWQCLRYLCNEVNISSTTETSDRQTCCNTGGESFWKYEYRSLETGNPLQLLARQAYHLLKTSDFTLVQRRGNNQQCLDAIICYILNTLHRSRSWETPYSVSTDISWSNDSNLTAQVPSTTTKRVCSGTKGYIIQPKFAFLTSI